jgi:hypothetical protein
VCQCRLVGHNFDKHRKFWVEKHLSGFSLTAVIPKPQEGRWSWHWLRKDKSKTGIVTLITSQHRPNPVHKREHVWVRLCQSCSDLAKVSRRCLWSGLECTCGFRTEQPSTRQAGWSWEQRVVWWPSLSTCLSPARQRGSITKHYKQSYG